jgi:ABC-type polysaccharide/polyol phosphate transport system ATPase subunit
MNAIEVERLSKKYVLGEDRPGGRLGEALTRSLRRIVRLDPRPRRDEIWALRELSVTVPEGEALGVIGPNGAGKSTLLKILSRITEPTGGVARTRGRVTSLLEVGTGFHPDLTGRENVYLNGAILGMRKKDIDRRFDEIVSFAGLERFIDTPVKRYSSGMYLRLAFAVAAHLEPDIMVVDEVLAVGDADFQAKCLGRMESAERAGRTVVFVSHNLEAITRLCTRAIWLERGVITAEGPASSVVDAYLVAQTDRRAKAAAGEPGDTSAVLRGIRVTDTSGRERHVLQREEPFVIEVRFWVRTLVPGLDLSVQVVDDRGIEVLNEAWSDMAPERPNAPGEYLARLEIPPLLNVGDYAVGVWIGSRYETLLHETAVRRLRLEGDAKGRPQRSVVAELPWEVKRLADPEDPKVLLPEATDTSQ